MSGLSIFATGKQNLHDFTVLLTVLADILESENSTHKTYCELVSKGQYRLLKAIACEGKVYEPYDAEFMRENGLTAPSSVRQALKILVEKGLVLKTDDGGYMVYDRLFSFWLAGA